jgi:hypothetical protein
LPLNKGDFVIDIKADLEEALAGFKWEVIGLLLEDQRVIDVPSDSRAISAIFEQLVIERIKPLADKYDCILEEGGGREYPDITLRDIPGIDGKIAIDVKTSRKKSPNTIGGFTIGTYLGYFRTPTQKVGTIRYPYADCVQHWIVGLCYNFETFEEQVADVVEKRFRITDIDVIVQEKWRIASRQTGSGTTKHMRSITNIEDLKLGRWEFASQEEFLEYWRNY